MAKRELVKDQDKFVVRLPAGMRERIRAKAETNGVSMNEAIVWCLEKYFPAPATLNDKIEELAELTAILKQGENDHPAIGNLIDGMHEALHQIAQSKIPAGVDFRRSVKDHLEAWQERKAEEWQDQNENPFDDPGGDLDDEDPKL